MCVDKDHCVQPDPTGTSPYVRGRGLVRNVTRNGSPLSDPRQGLDGTLLYRHRQRLHWLEAIRAAHAAVAAGRGAGACPTTLRRPHAARPGRRRSVTARKHTSIYTSGWRSSGARAPPCYRFRSARMPRRPEPTARLLSAVFITLAASFSGFVASPVGASPTVSWRMTLQASSGPRAESSKSSFESQSQLGAPSQAQHSAS